EAAGDILQSEHGRSFVSFSGFALNAVDEGAMSVRCRKEYSPQGLRFRHPAGGHAALRGEKAETSTMRSATFARTSSSWKMPRRATPAAFFSAIMATTTARFV